MAKRVPLIREVMSPVPVALLTDRTLEEAEAFLREFRVASAPVLMPGGSFVAILSDFQLLKCFLKRRQQTPNAMLLGNYLTEMEAADSVGEDETVAEGFRKMVASSTRRVFVTNRDGKLAGVLEPGNLFNFMADREEATKSTRKRRLTGDGQDIPPSLEELVFDEAPMPIHALDLSGKIVAANRYLHLLLGHERGDLVGKGLRDLYAHTHHEDAIEAMNRTKETGSHKPLPMQYVKKDQNLVKVDAISVMRYGDGGVPAGIVTVATVTEAKPMMDALIATSLALRPRV